MVDYLLPLLTFSTVFERFNIFVKPLDFSLKISLILLPVVTLILLLKKRLKFNPTSLFPFITAVLAVETISIFYSYDRFQSFQVVVFHLLMVGLFYLIVWFNQNILQVKRDEMPDHVFLDRLIGAWGVGALVVAILGFWQFGRFLLEQDPALFLDKLLEAKSLPVTAFTQNIFGRAFLRPSSTFIDVNTAASFIGIFLILGLGWFLTVRERRARVFVGLALVSSLAFFVIASSRSATLGLGAGLAVFAYLTLRGRFNKRLLLGGLAAFLALLIGLIIWLGVLDPARVGSSVERLGYAKAAVRMFKETRGLGVGAGNFEPYYTEVLRPKKKHGYSHSVLLTWVGETGVLGVLANFGLIAAVIVFLVREIGKQKTGSIWQTRLAALLGAFVALVAANIFHAHYGLEFTWVLLGLVVSGYYTVRAGNWKLETGRLAILGVEVDNVTMREAIDKVKEFFKVGKKAYVVTPNPEMVMLGRKDQEFAKILNGADLAIPDGKGLIWASRIFGTPLKERVTGTDLFQELCAEAARRGGQVFLLGAAPGVAEKAASMLKRRYKKLKVIGTYAGDGSDKGDKETVTAVNRAVEQSSSRAIDLLFIAYGQGKGERWIARNLKKVPVKVAVGVGGAFDFVAGEVARAPALIRRLGFEWLYRLARQPRRIFRQLVLVPFALLVFWESLRRR